MATMGWTIDVCLPMTAPVPKTDPMDGPTSCGIFVLAKHNAQREVNALVNDANVQVHLVRMYAGHMEVQHRKRRQKLNAD